MFEAVHELGFLVLLGSGEMRFGDFLVELEKLDVREFVEDGFDAYCHFGLLNG
jgi:hypothetical protein